MVENLASAKGFCYYVSMKIRGERKSFTLVELLIVIAIISIVTSFVVVSVRRSQSRARDSQRAADLAVLDGAVNMYYRETGHYPSLPNGCGNNDTPNIGWKNGISSDQVTKWATTPPCLTKTGYLGEYNVNTKEVKNLFPKYLAKLPVDSGPQIMQDGKAVRGYVYFHSVINIDDQDVECYKILAMNPENASLAQYKSIWDPARDNGTKDNSVDGTKIWGWSKYSKGCESK